MPRLHRNAIIARDEEITRLRAEVEALTKNLENMNADREILRRFVSDGMRDGINRAAEIVKLTAEVEALRAYAPDAARFRWMRDNTTHESLPFPAEDGRWVVQFFPPNGVIHEYYYKTLDAAIDAAMAKEASDV